MDSTTLRDAVDEAFATTGAGRHPWPDPHPWGVDPHDEEYSRCLDPGKYLILRARADAWAQALAGLGLAVSEEVTDPAGIWRDGPRHGLAPDRAVRLRPVRARTLPLLVGFLAVDGVPDVAVTVGAGEPAVLLKSLPDCGCDACDSGSELLLEDFDDCVLAVVSGEFVHIGRGEDTLVSQGSGWSASGRFARSRRDPERLLRDARSGRSRHPVMRGEAWW